MNNPTEIINLMPIDIVYAPNGDLSRQITFPISGHIAKLRMDKLKHTSINYQYTQIDIHKQSLMYAEYILPIGIEDVEENRIPFWEHIAQLERSNHWNVFFIVNNLVAQWIAEDRREAFISPATSNDGVIREDGKIIAVTKFNQFI